MAATLKPYLDCIRHSLDAALCLRDFPSQVVEKHNKPEIELKPENPSEKSALMSRELLLQPIKICRTETEKILIEPSINSVRISIRIKQADDIEELLAQKFTRFLEQRAEQFIIMRRKPVSKEYDISFLITNTHMEEMWKHKIVDFVIHFMEEIDKEINGMKIAVNTRARVVAQEYMKAFKA